MKYRYSTDTDIYHSVYHINDNYIYNAGAKAVVVLDMTIIRDRESFVRRHPNVHLQELELLSHLVK